MAEKQISQWNVTYRQRWEVMKYKYSIWVLKWIFQVSILYLSILTTSYLYSRNVYTNTWTVYSLHWKIMLVFCCIKVDHDLDLEYLDFGVTLFSQIWKITLVIVIESASIL